MGGGGSAPEPDKNIGRAALKSAKTGEAMLSWMRDQARITNEWAADDRAREVEVFRPLQDAFIQEANTWDSAARKNEAAQQAVADVRQQTANAEAGRVRQAMAMGINPNSSRFMAAGRSAALDSGLAAAGAQNMARRRVEQEAEGKRANAINMGAGLAVNPGTSMGLSNGALQAGGSAAMAGYGQQGSLLNTQYNQQLQSWQANQNSMSSMMGGQMGGDDGYGGKTHKTDGIYPDDRSIKQTSSLTSSITKNNLADFKKYLDDPNSEVRQYVGETGIQYTYDVKFSVFSHDPDGTLVTANGVTIGTPEDLALNGSLSSFFARKGIVFDLETGLFRVDNEYTMQIRLSGHGQRYAMVRKALQRNGILANRNVESETYIETGDLKGGGAFVLHRPGEEPICLTSIGDLLAKLHEISF